MLNTHQRVHSLQALMKLLSKTYFLSCLYMHVRNYLLFCNTQLIVYLYSCIIHKVDTSWTKKGHGAPPPISTTRSGFQMEAAPMVYSDEHGLDHVDSRPPPLPKIKSKCEDRDTNILMIKFGALSKPCKVHTGDPVICSNDQCAAILNCHSKIIKEGGKGSSNVRFMQYG